MKKLIDLVCTLCILLPSFCYAMGNTETGQETMPDPRDRILELSKKKWTWIMDRQTDSLEVLFDDRIVSRQPQISMDKPGHIDVIKNGNIRYRNIDIMETDIQMFDDLSILRTKVEFNFLGAKEPDTKHVTEV